MVMINLMRRSVAPVLVAAALLGSVSPSSAAIDGPPGTHQYYVGIDDFPTLTSGTYTGLANPNFNRLTFLWAHWDATSTSNHYHSKAIFTYTGPAGSPTVINSASNYVPEGTNPPVQLSAGTGIYSGKLVSNPYTNPSQPSYYFSNFTLGNSRALNGFGPTDAQTYLFNSSGGRWNSAFDAADVHWELVSLTPGLHVGNAGTLDIVTAPGDDVHLGEGSQSFAFTPVLWTDASAANGVYEARFKLTDESGTFGDSGVVSLRVEVVPEPGTLALLPIAGLLALSRRRRATVTT